MLLPVIGGLLGYLYSDSQDPVYEARATILVQYRGSGLTPGISDVGGSEQLAATYRRLMTATPFLNTIADRSGHSVTAAKLQSMLSVATRSNPPIIEVKVRSQDALLAGSTAQFVSEEFIEYAIEQRLAEIARLQSVAVAQGISNVQAMTGAQFAAVDTLSLLEPVVPPDSPVAPRPRRTAVLGAILGALLALGLAAALDTLNDTVRSPNELTKKFGVSNLGGVFEWTKREITEDALILWEAPTSGHAEVFRQIRANLEFAIASLQGNVFLFSSAGPGEGKTTVISNLAVAFAQAGKRVLIIDADMRRPSTHRLFKEIERDPGLSSYLANLGQDIDDVTYSTQSKVVNVLSAGPVPPNPAELLGSPRMGELLREASRKYDLVMVDSPPLLPVADGTVLASQVDGAVLVADAHKTRSGAFAEALEGLRNSEIHIMGAILNKLKRNRLGYGYGYPYYRYYYSYRQYYAAADEDAPNGVIGRIRGGVGSLFSRIRRSNDEELSA